MKNKAKSCKIISKFFDEGLEAEQQKKRFKNGIFSRRKDRQG
jgi:hypothetical protein